MKSNTRAILAAAAIAVAIPSAATAQDTLNNTAAVEVPVQRDDNDNDFPWGLLGLLGLAGLLGRKRDNDARVDRTDSTTRR